MSNGKVEVFLGVIVIDETGCPRVNHKWVGQFKAGGHDSFTQRNL